MKKLILLFTILLNSCFEIFQYIELTSENNFYVKIKITLSEKCLNYIGFTNNLNEFIANTINELKNNNILDKNLNFELITNNVENGIIISFIQTKSDDLIPLSPYYINDQLILLFPKSDTFILSFKDTLMNKLETKIILENLKYRLLINFNDRYKISNCYFFSDENFYKLNIFNLNNLYYLEIPTSYWISKDYICKLELNLIKTKEYEKLKKISKIENYNNKNTLYELTNFINKYYTIQIGIFEYLINAEKIAKTIRKINIIPEIEEIRYNNKKMYRLRVGKFESYLDCIELLEEIKNLDETTKDSFIILVEEK